MTSAAFDSIPWEQETQGRSKIFHKAGVAYKPNANALQNVEIWIPSPNNSTHVPEQSEFPKSDGVWVIYIHGGAWRDQNVDAATFASTVSNLASKHDSTLSQIGGIASINYSLTPRTHDAESPDFTNDPSRQAKHPDHIVDVLTALSFLQKKAGFGSNYVLSGHSCGATLALQVAMSHSKWSSAATSLNVAKPAVVLGLNGLYDMPSLINLPGEKHAHLKALYEVFTRLAFSDDKTVWQDISPVFVNDWKEEWKEGKKVVLVQSKEDSLVPYAQTEDMKRSLEKSRGEGLEVSEMEAGGDHNDLWKEGSRLAEIIVEVVESLL
jgi:acetyl esterase/lipase